MVDATRHTCSQVPLVLYLVSAHSDSSSSATTLSPQTVLVTYFIPFLCSCPAPWSLNTPQALCSHPGILPSPGTGV